MRTRLVGRVPEVIALDRLRAAAAGGSGAVALLVGEAGIGKTAVVEEAVSRAAAAGTPVLTGRAVPDEGAPAFWPWRRLLDDAGRRGIAGLPPQLLDPTGSGARGVEESAVAARFRVVHATVQALRAAAVRLGGAVLVLEDLHWADDASLMLLRHLCIDLGDAPILVIGTIRRPGEHPGLADLASLPTVEVLQLGPLEPPAVATYLGQLANGPVHTSWPAVVHRLTGGNPLYVRELCRLLDRDGRLRRPAVELDVPVELRRLVAHRTAQLSPPCQDLLGGCAAIGAEIDVPLLRAVAEAPDAVDGLLAEAVQSGVLTDDPWKPATVRFAHELLRQARYGELSRGERIGWHRRIADALADAGATEAELARHRVRAAVDAESRQAAAAACRAAAQAAGRRLDLAEAVRWYGQAVDLSGTEDPAHRATLLLARAEAAYRDGQLDVAIADCDTVLGIAESLHRHDLAAEAALVVRGIGGPLTPALAALCERALVLLSDEDGARRARVLAQHAFLLADLGDHVAAEAASSAAMTMATVSGRPEALVAAIHAHREVIDYVGRSDEAMELADRLCALARDSGRPDAELWGRTWRLDGRLMRGDLAGFDTEIHQLAGLGDRLGWPLARWHLARARAARALLAGRFAEAQRFAADARDLAERSQDTFAAGLYFAFMGSVTMHTGAGDRFATDAIVSMESVLDLPIAAAQLGQMAMHSGDRDTAAACWQRLAPMLPRLPRDGHWPYIVTVGGEVAAGLGDLDGAARCYRASQPYAGVYLNNTTACHGAADRPLGRMAAALGDHEAADRHLGAAVTMEERIGALPFLAQAQLTHAQALAVRAAPGDRERVQALAARAVATARRLGMPGVAAAGAALIEESSGVRGGAGTLTAREREIAALLAGGLANRAIAEHLVVSERTVETHVRNLLAKLGLSNRTQVATWAAQVGLRTASARRH